MSIPKYSQLSDRENMYMASVKDLNDFTYPNFNYLKLTPQVVWIIGNFIFQLSLCINVKLFIFVVAKLKWFKAELDGSRKAYSRAEVLLMIERYVKAQQIADTYMLLNHPDYQGILTLVAIVFGTSLANGITHMYMYMYMYICTCMAHVHTSTCTYIQSHTYYCTCTCTCVIHVHMI